MKGLIKKFIPTFLLDWYHFILALLGGFFYWFPSGRLKVIGVTGTNGKTTVTEMILKILEEAGYKVALMNSIRFKIGATEEKNTLKMTMPGRFRVQKFLRQAVNAKCQYAVLEVTSEGIKQHRHRFISFDTAVFTNLTPEHIEAHGSFEKYREAKGKLFRACKNVHIINLDDENADYFLQFSPKKKYGFTVKRSRDLDKKRLASSSVVSREDIQPLNLKLPGKFNVYNALAATSVGMSQGIDLTTCKKALEKVKGVPGRMEEVISKPFKVIVDYAVTPDTLEQAYRLIRNLFFPRKLICVFGSCGGGRDKWKRPILGEIAAKYCDKIIITNEDPYDEDPIQILENIEKGILKIKNLKLNKNLELKIKNYQKILDRREAIKEALELAKPDDAVVITGKGCEPWICVAGGKKIPWDDRRVVREEYEKIRNFRT